MKTAPSSGLTVCHTCRTFGRKNNKANHNCQIEIDLGMMKKHREDVLRKRRLQMRQQRLEEQFGKQEVELRLKQYRLEKQFLMTYGSPNPSPGLRQAAVEAYKNSHGDMKALDNLIWESCETCGTFLQGNPNQHTCSKFCSRCKHLITVEKKEHVCTA